LNTLFSFLFEYKSNNSYPKRFLNKCVFLSFFVTSLLFLILFYIIFVTTKKYLIISSLRDSNKGIPAVEKGKRRHYFVVTLLCHCETPKIASNRRKMIREKSNFSTVILNEVKNLCSWLTFCYDVILYFVQNVPIKINQCVCFACGTNDRGGRGRMTDTWFVIGRPQ